MDLASFYTAFGMAVMSLGLGVLIIFTTIVLTGAVLAAWHRARRARAAAKRSSPRVRVRTIQGPSRSYRLISINDQPLTVALTDVNGLPPPPDSMHGIALRLVEVLDLVTRESIEADPEAVQLVSNPQALLAAARTGERG